MQSFEGRSAMNLLIGNRVWIHNKGLCSDMNSHHGRLIFYLLHDQFLCLKVDSLFYIGRHRMLHQPRLVRHIPIQLQDNVFLLLLFLQVRKFSISKISPLFILSASSLYFRCSKSFLLIDVDNSTPTMLRRP
mmetsp:Transcript_19498/g.38755  ORF Transcript_19498/g.38755 Transcript_19498/m.38755 type:complete len:132 (-) Transcript_19498:573-968(-)